MKTHNAALIEQPESLNSSGSKGNIGTIMKATTTAFLAVLLMAQAAFQLTNISSAEVATSHLAFVPYQLPPLEAGVVANLSLQIQDQQGRETTATLPVTVHLESNSPSGTFRINGAVATHALIGVGKSSIMLEYVDQSAGLWIISATAPNFLPANATVTVNPSLLQRFELKTSNLVYAVNTPFEIRIRAVDAYGNTVLSFQDAVSLNDLTQTITPTLTDRFTSGQWDGFVLIGRSGFTRITASANGKNGNSTLLTIRSGAASTVKCSFKTVQQAMVDSALEIQAVVTDVSNNTVGDTTVSWEIISVPKDATGQGLVNSTTRTNSDGTSINVLQLGNQTGNYTVVAKESSSSQLCTLTATANPGPDFSIDLTSYDPRVPEGGNLSIFVKVSKRAGLNDYVSLRVSDVPPNVSVILNEPKELPNFTSQLIITVGPYANLGLYEIVLTGESMSGLSNSVRFSVQVLSAPVPFWPVAVPVAVLVSLFVCWFVFCLAVPFRLPPVKKSRTNNAVTAENTRPTPSE